MNSSVVWYKLLGDTLVLLSIGLCGWALFTLLRFPVAPLLGSVIAIGALRLSGFPLPTAPLFIAPLVQIMLGLFVGSRMNRQAIRELKTMAIPALLIVAWALSLLMVMGYFLGHISSMDTVTAMLSSSMGGLPEITVIALDTGADIPTIILMHSLRMLITVFAFPVILKYWIKREKQPVLEIDSVPPPALSKKELIAVVAEDSGKRCRVLNWLARQFNRAIKDIKSAVPGIHALPRLAAPHFVSLCIAAAGGFLFHYLGVPAGTMVGAIIATAFVSLCGIDIKPPPNKAFGFILVGLGIIIAENIDPGTITAITAGNLLLPALLLTVVLVTTSLLMAFLIYRITKWDFPTCFLAASPAGLSIMTALAVKHGRNPLRVSMLHLCRLLAIKIVLPFVFMFFF